MYINAVSNGFTVFVILTQIDKMKDSEIESVYMDGVCQIRPLFAPRLLYRMLVVCRLSFSFRKEALEDAYIPVELFWAPPVQCRAVRLPISAAKGKYFHSAPSVDCQYLQ